LAIIKAVKINLENMAISKKILNYLEENKYKYEIVNHKTTYTSWDTAQTEKIKPQEVGKTLVLKGDKDWFLVLLSANRNLDKKKFLKFLNGIEKKNGKKPTKKIDFAKEVWMKKNIKIGKLGSVPPFSGIFKKEIFVDKLFLKNKKIFVSTGEYDCAFRIQTGQFAKKEKIISGDFSMKKN
jgi:prolyl-tRNA editing enzyme YbaK/EbsC (Cys-tRNA(Pro) deacylase)